MPDQTLKFIQLQLNFKFCFKSQMQNSFPDPRSRVKSRFMPSFKAKIYKQMVIDKTR